MLDHATTPEKISNLFPWIAYDDEAKLHLLDEKYLGFGFLSEPLSGFNDSISRQFNTFLNYEFPAGAVIQITLLCFDDIAEHLNRIRKARNISEDPLIRRSTASTIQFLHDGAAGKTNSDIPIRNSKLLITIKVPIEDTTPSEQEMLDTSRMRLECLESITSTGFPNVVPLTDTELVHQMSLVLNRSEDASWRAGRQKPDENLLIRDTVLDFDQKIVISDDHVAIGDNVVSSLSVKKLPMRAFFGLARRYSVDPIGGARGIPCSHMITGTIFVDDVTKVKPAIERRRQTMGHFASGPFGRIRPEYKERHADLEMISKVMSDGEAVHKMSLCITLFNPSHDNAQRSVMRTKTYLSELGVTALQDKCVCFPLLRYNLPFGAVKKDLKALQRFHTLPTKAITALLPAFFEWRGTMTPLISLVGRAGQVMGFSPWDSATNYNMTISAESGAGKSFLANEIISAVLGTGGKAWVIDVGLSYQKLNESFGGQFMRFTPDSHICLNPFSSLKTIEDFNEVSDILKSLIAAMAAPKGGLTDFQNSMLVEVLRTGFEEHGKDLTIDHIAGRFFELAKEHQDGGDRETRLSDIGHGLAQFRKDGTFGRYFNGPANIDFTSNFVCLELEELKSQKHLQTIVLLLLIYQIQQGMYLGDRSQKKLLLIDEAWDLLSDDAIASFVEAGYRRFRKYNGAACVITQSLLDLNTSKTGLAIQANSASRIMLKQRPETLDALSKGDNALFDGELANMLKTVNTVPGKYSEVFIQSAQGQGIGRFVVDPFTGLLYSTNPRDKSAIDKYVQAGMSTGDAINAVLEENGKARIVK